MDQSLMNAERRALDDAFHRMHAASRCAGPPSYDQRIERLDRLRKALLDNEARFVAAIEADFGHRSRIETEIAEVLTLLGEIKHARKHVKTWMAPKRVSTQPQFLPAKNRLIAQPLGVVGVIAPWNYPLQLTLAPAIGAIAAGNRVLIKPSELTPRLAALLQEVIAAHFPADEMLVTGVSPGVAEAFTALPFDHLLFTGSTRVGRIVAEAAGRNLTPVTLELGGKSPTIIDASADLDAAAERIAYAKLLNAGQTCIAPDYVLIAPDKADGFAAKIAAAMTRMMGRDPANADYTAIISERHYQRLQGLVRDAEAQGATALQPAAADAPEWSARRKFPPTVLTGVSPDMAVMQEEIFGPVLPVLPCASTEEAIRFINGRDRPLALYWFGDDDAARDSVLTRVVTGGVTINDCLVHFAQINQPLGGVGASGTGAYHGEWGFRTFSKLTPVFYRSRFNRFADLYPPYGAKVARLAKVLRMLS